MADSKDKQMQPVTRITPLDGYVGARLRIRRNELGLSQPDLAKAMGVTFTQVQKYEYGDNRVPAGRLAAAAAFLQVPIGYFYGGHRRSEHVASDELDMLRVPGALELLRYYSRVQSPKYRKPSCSLQNRWGAGSPP